MQVPKVPGTFPHAHDPFWSAPGAGGGICSVWAGNGNSPASTGTDGKGSVGTWDQRSGRDLFSLQGRQQALSVCTAAGTKNSPIFREQGELPEGGAALTWVISHTREFETLSKLWNLGMNRNFCNISVVLQPSTSGASSSKDVGFFSFSESWTMRFVEGVFNFFFFRFVLYLKYF